MFIYIDNIYKIKIKTLLLNNTIYTDHKQIIIFLLKVHICDLDICVFNKKNTNKSKNLNTKYEKKQNKQETLISKKKQ